MSLADLPPDIRALEDERIRSKTSSASWCVMVEDRGPGKLIEMVGPMDEASALRAMERLTDVLQKRGHVVKVRILKMYSMEEMIGSESSRWMFR